jgi:hypothetical protein
MITFLSSVAGILLAVAVSKLIGTEQQRIRELLLVLCIAFPIGECVKRMHEPWWLALEVGAVLCYLVIEFKRRRTS